MEENYLSKLLDEILIISMDGDEDHFNQTYKNLKEAGFDENKIKKIHGVSPKSQEVKDLYKNGIIGKNPKLTPEKIGNWISHYNCWKRIKENNSKFTAICEDDIEVFKERLHLLEKNKEKLKELSNKEEPLLLRISMTGKMNIKNPNKNIFNDKTDNLNGAKVSNPFYIMNWYYAKLGINKANKIEETSDVFIHNSVCKGKNSKYAYAFLPNLFYDKTHYLKTLKSRIRTGMKRYDK